MVGVAPLDVPFVGILLTVIVTNGLHGALKLIRACRHEANVGHEIIWREFIFFVSIQL